MSGQQINSELLMALKALTEATENHSNQYDFEQEVRAAKIAIRNAESETNVVKFVMFGTA